ncbi:long-chain-fatty-acid--CoA ligase [Raineyella fluvialis]|uniref:AMP-binding protein n=1 Tax=Raineyella fluvialis TaxID=2662261 RepID=A0A5Q2F8F7_9ACTN|nr:long-chain-fatty-acid--CoA ligase [Raineyella fluvialis]QGF22948.1 AMP-binding protein [Raineyella fluvialis]
MTTSPPPAWVSAYQPGVPAEIDLPTESLFAMFERSVAEGGDAVAMTFFGRTTTYAALGDAVFRAAEGLRLLGVRPGDRVALMLPNCPQHVVAFYAALRLGAVVVEHNPLYTGRELEELFADHGARVAIAWDVAAPKLQGFAAEHRPDTLVSVNMVEEFPAAMRAALRLPVKKLRDTRGSLTAPTTGTMRWKALLAHPPVDPEVPRPTVDDLAVIQYTSGTTGHPKGAMLSHFNLYSNALQGKAWMKDAEYRKENFYAVLPMFHAFGMTLYLTYGVLRQANLVLFPKFDVDLVLKAATRFPPTVYCAVPPIYERTARAAIERGVSLRSAKFCISGAMALTDPVVELWESVSGGLLVEGYGMTESSPVALGNPFWPTRRTGTIGVPFPSTLMKVVDPEDPTREVARGERGELLIKGPQVFQGYWHNPEETAKTLLADGWLRTGDLVVVDEDGYTTIVDRAKELIITGGFNVAPSEVEQAIRTFPGVKDVAVVGKRQNDGAEMIVAVIEAEPGARIDEAEVRAHCRGMLAAYKVPRRVITAEGELPRSMLGKVLRKQVRETLVL